MKTCRNMFQFKVPVPFSSIHQCYNQSEFKKQSNSTLVAIKLKKKPAILIARLEKFIEDGDITESCFG